MSEIGVRYEGSFARLSLEAGLMLEYSFRQEA